MSNSNTAILLVPLDERPVNTRYPEMIGEIGGAEVLLPPQEIRGFLRQPADLPKLAEWVNATVANETVSAALVSCDFVGYGNLINSRISNDSATDVISRLAILSKLNERIPVHAFSLITRVSNANDNVEEPLYWSEWGEKFYAYARLAHRVETGDSLDTQDQVLLDYLARELPEIEKADWLKRRLRNHTVNLALMDMAAHGQVESLLLTSDDTSPYGFPTRERDWLAKWSQMLGSEVSRRIQMHPGADEVGSALVAKSINKSTGLAPKVWVDYAIPADKDVVALYEDRPIESTVLGQIDACGCVPASTPDDADFVLGVVTPSRRRIDYRIELANLDVESRAPYYLSFLDRMAAFQNAGMPVALADVAFPNGSDPQMSEVMLSASCPLSLGDLAAYGAWNTAGNTLGTVVAQASAFLACGDNHHRKIAQQLFLTHRFLEDYGYQQVVRREARDYAQKTWGHREPDPKSIIEQRELCDFIEGRLNSILTSLQIAGIGQEITVERGSVRLPWLRTFEVDFSLKSLYY